MTSEMQSVLNAFDGDFFDRVFEREPAYVPFTGTWEPQALVSIDEIEHLAVVPPGTPMSNLRVSRVAKDGSVDEATIEPGTKPTVLGRYFQDGYTIVCDEINTRVPAIYALCEQLKERARRLSPVVVRQHTTCGLFLTPPATQGLALHHDLQNVFALQLAGSKTWSIYEPLVRDAVENSTPDLYRHANPRLLKQVTLRAGDALYVPRGFAHQVHSAEDGYSMHVSIGITTLTWQDVIAALVAAQPALRCSVPSVVDNDEFERLRHVLQEMLGANNISKQLETALLADLFRAPQFDRGVLSDAVTGGPRPPFTIRFPEYTVQQFEDTTVLAYPGGVLRFPRGWHAPLKQMLAYERIDERTVQQCFPDGDSGSVLEHLLAAGFLRGAQNA